ncbi:MAG: signal peptide peptidase SppA [Bacteroidota bacterium]
MRAFFRNLLATIIGLFIFSIMGVFFLGWIGSALSMKKEFSVKPKSIMILDLNKPIIEQREDDSYETFKMFPGVKTNLSIVEVKRAINRAAFDDNIEGIYIKASWNAPGYAMIEEIRNDLIKFKESGKWVIAYGQVFSEKSYYLSSVANQIFLHPVGEMELNGLSSTTAFFKGTFDKLGVEPQIFRVGKYKSFVEPFTLTELSESNREQQQQYLSSLNTHLLQEIGKSRDFSMDQMKELSDGMLVRSSVDALEYGLVDGLKYTDEVLTWIKDEINISEDEDIETVSLNQYASFLNSNRGDYKKDKIAVIIAEGDIVGGEGDRENIGGDKFSREIRKARTDDNVKAVVLRINSPGGSALASDVMWREVELTSRVKPVIASMSNVAASGGYYMAMACDTIVAQPNTITGSIGIFGMIFNMESFFEDKLGVTTDVVSTGEFSDLLTVSRPLNDAEKAIIQNMVEEGYETFISKAAEGRDMTVEEINTFAQGRVWTGQDALEVGLVDVLGGYNDAINIAAESAGLEEDEYRIVYLPRQKPLFEELFEDIVSNVQTYYVEEKYGALTKYVDKAEKMMQYNGIMARLPFDLEIQ